MKNQVYIRIGQHFCQEEKEQEITKICDHCQILYNKNFPHFCYIQPTWMQQTQKAEAKNIRFIFFDIESTQDRTIIVNGVQVKNFFGIFFSFDF